MENEVKTVKYALELKHITKTFGKTIANKNVSINLKKGEILSLLGENGSGKTTLMNILSGIYFPDEGKIFIDGKEALIKSPRDSFHYKIGMVHQHFKLIDIFSAAENIILGMNTKIKLRNVNKEVKELAKKYGFDIDPEKKVYQMSVSEKQTVEIIKVLYRGADILILDEPTAVLTPQEVDKLFKILVKMRDDGKSIIIITHKLNEVMEISDRVTILRKGHYIGTVDTKSTNEKELTEMMVGEKINLEIKRPKIEMDKPLLEIRKLVINGENGNKAIKDVSFYIRGGEIMGVAGISGCGQKELCEAIAGLRPINGGSITHKGENIIGLKPNEIIEKGISMSFIPEDRLGMGLVSSFSITDNMMLKTYHEGKGIFVDRKKARIRAMNLIEELSIDTPSTETPIRLLSGGNVQKVLVGREIKSDPNVIITAYPVRGLDINSSYAIYDILNEQKAKGTGILFIGEDLDVMIALCDKIMVLCHGEVMGIVQASKTSKEQIGLMMTGSLNLVEKEKNLNLVFAPDSLLTKKEWKAEINKNKEKK